MDVLRDGTPLLGHWTGIGQYVTNLYRTLRDRPGRRPTALRLHHPSRQSPARRGVGYWSRRVLPARVLQRLWLRGEWPTPDSCSPRCRRPPRDELHRAPDTPGAPRRHRARPRVRPPARPRAPADAPVGRAHRPAGAPGRRGSHPERRRRHRDPGAPRPVRRPRPRDAARRRRGVVHRRATRAGLAGTARLLPAAVPARSARGSRARTSPPGVAAHRAVGDGRVLPLVLVGPAGWGDDAPPASGAHLLPYLPAEELRSLVAGAAPCLPLPLRGFRPARPGGHGRGHAGPGQRHPGAAAGARAPVGGSWTPTTRRH